MNTPKVKPGSLTFIPCDAQIGCNDKLSWSYGVNVTDASCWYLDTKKEFKRLDKAYQTELIKNGFPGIQDDKSIDSLTGCFR